MADFSAENLQARRECHVILKVQKGKTKKKTRTLPSQVLDTKLTCKNQLHFFMLTMNQKGKVKKKKKNLNHIKNKIFRNKLDQGGETLIC